MGGNPRQVSGGSKPTKWDADCGGSFGHELMFSKTLEKLMLEADQGRSFEAVKNARGGSKISEWYPNNDGVYWEELKRSITSRKGGGNWKGFLWHQGSQGESLPYV